MCIRDRDWDWIRGHVAALLRLTQEFSQKFSEQKHADGVLDFHDLEQLDVYKRQELHESQIILTKVGLV